MDLRCGTTLLAWPANSGVAGNVMLGWVVGSGDRAVVVLDWVVDGGIGAVVVLRCVAVACRPLVSSASVPKQGR